MIILLAILVFFNFLYANWVVKWCVDKFGDEPISFPLSLFLGLLPLIIFLQVCEWVS
jgi:hypothetical protein